MEVLAVIVLAVVASLLATSRGAYRLRRSPLVMGLLAGGWPAVGVGLLLGDNGFGLISAEMLRSTAPLMIVGLGWIGMMVGLQLRVEVLRTVPRRLLRLSVVDACVCLAVWGVVAAAGLWWWVGGSAAGGGLAAAVFGGWALLVACGVGWSMETRSQRVTGRTAGGDALAMALRMSGALSGVIAVVLYGAAVKLPARGEGGAVSIAFGSAGVSVVLAFALASFTAVVGRFAMRLAGKQPGHQLAVFLGLVSFSAGIAAQTGLSPLLASLLTGAVLTNLASSETERFMRFILEAEQTVAVLFAFLAGVLASASIGVAGVALAVVLALLRVTVKPGLVRRVLGGGGEEGLGGAGGVMKKLPARSTLYASAARQSPVAIAMGVGLVVLEWSPFHRELLMVVLLTGVLSEVFPQLLSAGRRTAVASGGVPEPEGAGGRTVVGGGASAAGVGGEGGGA